MEMVWKSGVKYGLPFQWNQNMFDNKPDCDTLNHYRQQYNLHHLRSKVWYNSYILFLLNNLWQIIIEWIELAL